MWVWAVALGVVAALLSLARLIATNAQALDTVLID